MRVVQGRVVAVRLSRSAAAHAGAGSYAVQATQQRAIVVAEFRTPRRCWSANDVKLTV